MSYSWDEDLEQRTERNEQYLREEAERLRPSSERFEYKLREEINSSECREREIQSINEGSSYYSFKDRHPIVTEVIAPAVGISFLLAAAGLTLYAAFTGYFDK